MPVGSRSVELYKSLISGLYRRYEYDEVQRELERSKTLLNVHLGRH